MKKKYDYKDNEINGFFEWNKPYFLIDEKDERSKRFDRIRKRCGMTPDETWSLNTTICVFMVPRLKMFKKYVIKLGAHPGCFNSVDEWVNVLNQMIWSFENYLKDGPDEKFKEKFGEKADKIWYKRIDKGLKQFAKCFSALWW